MATTLTTCPGKVCTCGGTAQVTVRQGTDRRSGRATVTYGPCAPLVAQGWTGKVALVEWADRPQTVLRHRDGLVAFAL